MRGQGYYRTDKNDKCNGSKQNVNLKNRNYISVLSDYCPDKCVSLVLLLA